MDVEVEYQTDQEVLRSFKFTTKRGAFMGLSLAWAILNVLNKYAVQRSREELRLHPAAYRAEVCGDDAALAGPSGRVVYTWTHKYAEVLEEVGLKINRSKTFIGTSGVFVENHVRVKNGRFVTVPITKMAQVTTARAMEATGRLRDDDAPVTHTLGPALQQLKKSCRRFHVVKAIVLRRHARHVKALKRFKIPLNLPQHLGGAGIPGTQDMPRSMRVLAAHKVAPGQPPLKNHFSSVRVKDFEEKQIHASLASLPHTKEGVKIGDAQASATALYQRQRLIHTNETAGRKYKSLALIGKITRNALRLPRRNLNPMGRHKCWHWKPKEARVPASEVRQALVDYAPEFRDLKGKVNVDLHFAIPLGHKRSLSSAVLAD
jgi:hypothetical protein